MASRKQSTYVPKHHFDELSKLTKTDLLEVAYCMAFSLVFNKTGCENYAQAYGLIREEHTRLSVGDDRKPVKLIKPLWFD